MLDLKKKIAQIKLDKYPITASIGLDNMIGQM